MNLYPENCVLPVTESTNDLARKLAEVGRPEGTWISARLQTGGRGRSGRSWVSEEGNLFLSLVTRIEDRSLWTWIPLASAIALRNACIRLKEDLAEDLKIKWPNDLYLGGGKCAGILCETVNSSVVIGVGANCSQAPVLEEASTRSLGIPVDSLRGVFLEEITRMIQTLRSDGAAPLQKAYDAACFFKPGDEIFWGESNGATEQKQGRVEGLGPFGELKVKLLTDTPAEFKSRIVALYSEDVSKVRKPGIKSR